MEIITIVILLLIAAETTYLILKNNQKNGGKKGDTPIFVDTSVLIDGRIMAVASSGFITDTLMIPRSVIGELQFLADHADSEKRARARHGLDVITDLQALDNVNVDIFPDGSRAEEGVDERLLKLAKQHSGVVCTIDYNLNKVAQVENITVLNVNDLAMSLRMAYLPGEKILLELTQKGQDAHQAVGHLKDGTMVVVEHANKHIGQTVEIEFVRSLQTAAGKMMFARLVEASATKKHSTKTRHNDEKANKNNKAKAYHSDSKDRRVASTNSKKTNDSNSKSRRKPTSFNRETDLIKLVNNQQD